MPKYVCISKKRFSWSFKRPILRLQICSENKKFGEKIGRHCSGRLSNLFKSNFSNEMRKDNESLEIPKPMWFKNRYPGPWRILKQLNHNYKTLAQSRRLLRVVYSLNQFSPIWIVLHSRKAQSILPSNARWMQIGPKNWTSLIIDHLYWSSRRSLTYA